MNVHSPEHDYAAQNERLVNQINRLQERQRELVVQTADELESIKGELQAQHDYSRQPLLTELSQLRNEMEALLHEREVMRHQLQTLHSSIGSLIDISPPTQNSLPRRPVVTVTAVPIKKPTVKKSVSPPPKEKKPRVHPKKKVLQRALLTFLLAAVGYIGALGSRQLNLGFGAHASGQVAGASIVVSSPSAAPQQMSDQAPEAQAEIPFRDTLWDTDMNSDFGVRFDYPRNTSKLVSTVGSSNIWVIRKDGYLLKINKQDASGQTLDQYWASIQDNYASDYSISKTSFKGQPAIFLQPQQPGQNAGGTYLVKWKNTILSIWVKNEPPTTDDGQRIARIVSSFTLTP